MRKTTNQDGSTSYTLTSTEKLVIWTLVSYLWGRRAGYYQGRRDMVIELEKSKKET